ncbi:hypothetical protein Q9L58_010142 [Maublancomyces gigas]|uniref:Uncharacterized protein n=1 Tax=Discina gigas TaxID=1032678 RepID=A0ABR3G5B3_9PEZI
MIAGDVVPDLADKGQPAQPSTIDEAVKLIRAFYSTDVLQPMVMNLSEDLYDDFVEACEQASHGHPLYKMRYTYDGSTGNLIVKCTTTPLHDGFERFLHTTHQDIIQDHGLLRSERSFDFVCTGDTGGFSGSHRRSRKTADAMIVPVLPRGSDEDDTVLNGGFPLVAVEVGFSQTYESLLLDMRKWLEGSAGMTRAVILISFSEDPMYSSKPSEKAGALEPELPPVPESSLESAMPPPAPPRPPYGPIVVGKHIVVGEIKVFLEIWRYDAIKEAPYLESHISILPIDEDTPDFCLTMLDLYGTEERMPDRFNATDLVKFSLDDYRREIRMSLPRLANQRKQKIKQKRKKPQKEEEV